MRINFVGKSLQRSFLTICFLTPTDQRRRIFCVHLPLTNSFLSRQAKVILYEGAVAKKELVFDASGTDKLNWYSEAKLSTSSWSDLKTETKNFFSIQGGCGGAYCRSFFINRNYGGCGVDAGWVVTATVWCSWENSPSRLNKVLYSKLSTYTNWNTNGEDALEF